ncbi:hypothetical protein N4227_05215 [Yersinia enterocolitica]|uniref:hypothetical protein n=1 Tax=Yersinia enterocolitica TaxID=630 RepID=UPI0005E1856B|nr:hypothetical protein [Yersinia enterocolitica]EKN6133518.1 hypothetical protein [Yersinia enterocolitica]EKN6194682.1 hypothetical protein [Yersinia enterocolitica]EKN6407838.1 hypothetical protein [Yersinia enterocolitica]UYJ77759.1 hypothetical protein N4227_05215 [Yersinia enterocolitica]CNF14081.1 Uncharacterised protein [Yersinia enterocolitica]
MLDGYYDLDGAVGESVSANRKRLLAMQAALEIAKASAGSSDAANGARVGADLTDAAEHISALADAIQKAMKI